MTPEDYDRILDQRRQKTIRDMIELEEMYNRKYQLDWEADFELDELNRRQDAYEQKHDGYIIHRNWGEYMDEVDDYAYGESLRTAMTRLLQTGAKAEGKQQSSARVRETQRQRNAPNQEPKTRGQKVEVKDSKGKEKEKEKEKENPKVKEKDIPCNRKECPGQFQVPYRVKGGAILMGADGQPVMTMRKCRFAHPQGESLIKTSNVLPKSISRKAHAIVDVNHGGEPFTSGNAFVVGGRVVSLTHVLKGDTATLRRRDEDRNEVTTVVKFQPYKKVEELVFGGRPTGYSGYKMAVPEEGERVYLVGWDVRDKVNPVWHVSDGYVGGQKDTYLPATPNHLTHTCSSFDGLSGGLLLNEKGQAVGVHWGGVGCTGDANAFIPFTEQIVQDFSAQGVKNTH